MNLKGKVAVVTGSSSGIGAAVAFLLAKEGVKVIVNSRNNVKGGQEVVKKIVQEGGEAEYIQADLSELNGAIKLFGDATKKYKTVDILINNAGQSTSGELNDLKVWDYQIKNILMSCVNSTNEFLNLKSTNLRKIVNTSSIYGSIQGGNLSYMAYSAMKAAINNLTINLAKKFRPNIMVNAVAPGWTWTPPWGSDRTEEERLLRKATNISRFVESEEIADIVISILKNDAITGQIITVDMGATLKDLY